jgi:tetratricopeptide (TPR) repeat protein
MLEHRDRADLAYMLAEILAESGRLEEAVANYQAALRARPDWAEAFDHLGAVYRRLDNVDAAIGCFERSLELRPDHFQTMCRLLEALWHVGKHERAVPLCRSIVELRPDSPQAICDLASALVMTGEYGPAIDLYRRAIEIQPDMTLARENLGAALIKAKRYGQAIEVYQGLLALQPDNAQAHHQLGIAFQPVRNWEGAIAEFEAALRIEPGNLGWSVALGILYLKLGKFGKGWPLFELRMRAGADAEERFSQPRWDGADAPGRTILLHAEGGYGDTLQYARFVPMVRQRAGRVVLECRKELVELLKSVDGLDEVVARGDALPAADFHISLVSLPAAFKTELGSLPNRVPYVTAPPQRLMKWKSRVPADGIRNIGICWAGNLEPGRDDPRPCRLEELAPVLRVRGVRFYSLRLGLERPDVGAERWVDYTADLSDFADTAALIQYLDLVISIDTSVAHLAGALGKPIWLLTPYYAAYAWMLDRTDSPWYPTMRLFRQQAASRWDEPIDQIAAALTDFVTKPSS